MVLETFNFSHIVFQVKVGWDELKVDFVGSWEESGAEGREVKSWARGPDVAPASVDLEPAALPLLAALVEEVAASGVDPDVVRWETGRRDVEVSNFGTQVIPEDDDPVNSLWSHLVSPLQVLFSVTLAGGEPEKETTPKYLKKVHNSVRTNCTTHQSPVLFSTLSTPMNQFAHSAQN